MKKIWLFLKNLFSKTKQLARKFVTPSVMLVENLKNFIESPVTPVITAIIPGNLDNKIAEKLEKALPQILQALRISDECIQLEKPQEIFECALRKLKEYNPEAKAAQFHSIAALLSVTLSDGKISWREAIHLTEEIYQQIRK